MTPSPSSSIPDLQDARDAAQAVLVQVRRWSRIFTAMGNPYREGAVETDLPPRPTFAEMLELRGACQAALQKIPNSIVTECAGLTTPSGVRAGGAYFASAHELVFSVANGITDSLSIILPEDVAVADPNGTNEHPDAAHQRVIVSTWSADGLYYRQLLWDIAGMTRAVAVPRARMLIDCEFAMALRNRELLAALQAKPAVVVVPSPQVDRSARRSMNPFSPSTKASVTRLVAGIRKLAAEGVARPLKLTAVYHAAGLRGQSQQRASNAARDAGFVTKQHELTSEGSRFLDAKE